ncbi:MAG: sigma-54 dependent transcriptional regulator [Brevundimonas sp.]|uniref:sigma-54-dependent transcriptional regulator n=1 Tax=Brevundimonas sp. TaxID=1871086 RepID=UPI00273654C2|nr:sigma-54 dependent transcriptional regulator [Brevundimonas sp.]MDP3406221.1 sigma-54 dependent transcriptional regulator [Brevundimonas sp.]
MNFARPCAVTLIDDDEDFRAALVERLRLQDLEVREFASAEAALKVLNADYPGVVVTDLRMPGMDGRGLLSRLQSMDPDLPVVMITGHGDIAEAVEALRHGAYDFVAKPFDFARLNESLVRALEKRGLVLDNRALALAAARARPGTTLLGASPAIERLRSVVDQIADAEMDVLIEGPTGVGKEVVARALHEGGRRRVHRFVAMNCGALPEGLIETELFGSEPGAFPGALRRRIGLVEQSHRGTLFLDEVESLSPAAQLAMLRVVEQREIQPIGAAAARRLDLRILSASKIDLADAVARGRFRDDLYHRLNVVKLRVPPLVERREDIPLLFAHFLALAGKAHGQSPKPLSAEGHRRLVEHLWPGNVRELAHFAERAALGLEEFALAPSVEAGGGLADQIDRYEKSILEASLAHHAGAVKAVGEALRLPRKTLYDKLARHGLSPSRFRTTARHPTG